MKKKDQISDVARKLFNEHGVNNMNTNIISKECGISPGNLYYHYRNKEEIIRKIFLELSMELDSVWSVETNDFFNFFEGMIGKLIENQMKYSFFYKEMFSLFQNDVELKNEYKKLMNRRRDEIALFLKGLMKNEILKEISDEELYDYIDLFWLNIDFFILMCDLKEEMSTEKKIEKFKRNLYNLVYIYLTDKGKQELKELMK